MHRRIAFAVGLVVCLGSLASAQSESLSTDQQAVVARLITELGAEEFQARESATQSLIKFGEAAEESLEAALESTKDPEVAFRLRRIFSGDQRRPARSPEGIVKVFLEAVIAGNHDIAAQCLTKRAREAMSEAGMHVHPPGSPDATFKIGEVRVLPKDGGAHVDSAWTDEQRRYEITWIVRGEGDAWAIAGMATRLFEDSPPLILNFENPAEMIESVRAAEEEIDKRAKP